MPAKTLTGVWRDACEIAARALDSGPGGPWRHWVDAIFGSQPALEHDPDARAGRPSREALVRVRRARYRPGVRDAVAGHRALAAAATFVKPGVHVDAASGRARPGMLRFEECARAGVVLEGTVELVDQVGLDLGEVRLDVAQRRCATALLLAGARLLEQLGGKRRRGSGRCTLELPTVAADPEAWWRWLEALDQPVAPPPSAPDRGPRPAAPAQQVTAAEGWEVARLRLTLDSPLIAGSRTLGKDILGRDLVPGATLLPQALRMLGGRAVTALRNGHLLVTDATVDIDGTPGLAVPRTLAAVKSDRSRIVNQANRAPTGDDRRVQLKAVKEGHVAPDEPFRYRRLTRAVTTHNSVEDEQQRPTTAAGGGLFTYRALPAGTRLWAEVRVRAGVLPPGWQEKLTGSWALGRSRKDYGAVTVEAEPRLPAQPRPGVAAGHRIAVWLVSDLLLLDARLRPTTDPATLRAKLGAALGVGLVDVGGDDHADHDPRVDERVHSVRAPGRSESWQRRWRLPRPTLLGFAAGSVVTYDVAGRLDPARVAAVETEGVGERRGEGFGQVRVAVLPVDGQGEADGPFVVTTFREGRVPDGDRGEHAPDGLAGAGLMPAVSERAEDAALVRSLEREAWRAEIACRAEVVAREKRSAVLGAGVEGMRPTQLGLLRDVVARLGGERSEVTALIGTLGNRSLRRAWPPSVVEAVSKLLIERDPVWDRVLEWTEWTWTGLTTSAEAATALREELWVEAVQAVVLRSLTALRRDKEGVGR